MRRIFLGAAILAWSASLAIAGLGSRPMGWAAASATLLIHAWAWAVLARGERRARSSIERAGWPDWIAAQTEKNRRKALSFGAWGGALVVAMAGSEGAWRIGLASATIAFHLGAFPAQGLLIAAQGRLLRPDEARGGAGRSP